MKRDQYKFMEKRVKRTTKANQDEEKTITITIWIAIVILLGLLIYLALTPGSKEPSTAIYYLDSEKKAENFPKTVVLGENNTFPLWIGVENQNDTTEAFSVLIKFDDGTGPVDPSPVNATETFEKTLVNKGVWEFQVTISVDQLGSNRIIFELWFFNGTTLEYTGNWVDLSVEAIQA